LTVGLQINTYFLRYRQNEKSATPEINSEVADFLNVMFNFDDCNAFYNAVSCLRIQPLPSFISDSPALAATAVAMDNVKTTDVSAFGIVYT